VVVSRSGVVPGSGVVAGSRSAVAHDRREALALVVVDELVVGHAALVHLGAFLHQAGFGALLLGCLLGHAGLLLGCLGAVLALAGGGAMLVRDRLAALHELALGLLALSRSTHPGQQHEQPDDDERHHDEDDDQSCGHRGLPFPFGSGCRR
jgi:hypothetical protein